MKQLLFLSVIVALISSCQKVIDVDLNEANPKVVIEANYTAEDSTVAVVVSKTANYFGSNAPTKLNNAVITITDQSGVSTNVPLIGDGFYELNNYIPAFNSTYTLTVSVDEEIYSASCTLNPVVPLEDITYEYTPGFFGSGDGYVSYLNFYDPANVINHYIVVITENGEELNKPAEFILQDDVLTDGNLVERPLFTGELFQIGDEIGFELRSVDEVIYDYYAELQSVAGGGQSSAAPANPTSNWGNEALGYFSAYSNNRKSVIIQ